MLKNGAAVAGVLLLLLLPFVSPNELAGNQGQTSPRTGYTPVGRSIFWHYLTDQDRKI
jgi:hypothetical protein